MKKWLNICTHLHGYNKKFTITTGEDYTHAILYLPESNKTARPSLTIPKENVVACTGEAPPFWESEWNMVDISKNEIINYLVKYVGYYFVGDTTNQWYPTHKPFHARHVSFSRKPLKPIYKKNKMMSIIFSVKSFIPYWTSKAPGYKYRKNIIEYILSNNLPIDIYGTGCAGIKKPHNNRVKGEFIKGEPYEDYIFHIAIENYSFPHYITEKFTNCLIYHTIPVYVGGTRVGYYYPNSCIRLTGRIEHDINIIVDILKFPQKYLKNTTRACKYLYDNNHIINYSLKLWGN